MPFIISIFDMNALLVTSSLAIVEAVCLQLRRERVTIMPEGLIDKDGGYPFVKLMKDYGVHVVRRN